MRKPSKKPPIIRAEPTAGETPALALRMPYRRDVLGFEFIPTPHADAHLVSQSGHAFTKIGAPALTDGEPAYDYAPADGIKFALDDIQPLLAADPSGFTAFFVIPGTNAGPGEVLSLFNLYDDPAIDNSPLGAYAQDHPPVSPTSVGIVPYVGHTETEYEAGADYGAGYFHTTGQRVLGFRYERQRALQAQTVTAAAYEATRNRTSYFKDGVDTPHDGFGPDPLSEEPNVQDGTLLVLPLEGVPLVDGGGFTLGSLDGDAYVAYPRMGAVWIFTEALSDAEMLAISTWIKNTHVVTYPT